jgi:hypothetical protein
MTYNRVTYVAIADDKPLISTHEFEDLRKSLDQCYGVGNGDSKCLGFYPHITKYPDELEGHFKYEYSFNDKKEIDEVKIYCVEFYPHTTYEK